MNPLYHAWGWWKREGARLRITVAGAYRSFAPSSLTPTVPIPTERIQLSAANNPAVGRQQQVQKSRSLDSYHPPPTHIYTRVQQKKGLQHRSPKRMSNHQADRNTFSHQAKVRVRSLSSFFVEPPATSQRPGALSDPTDINGNGLERRR